MSTENRSSASTAIDLSLGAPGAHRPSARVDGEPQARVVRLVGTDRRRSHGPRQPFRTTTPGRFDDTLPVNDFLRTLHREMRRAERSQEALSIVVYEVGALAATGAPRAEHLLEVIHGIKRETDILGHAGDDLVAVLCTHTDHAGLQALMRKIDAKAGDLSYQTLSATYPDDLFEGLAAGSRLKPEFQPFLVPAPTASAHSGYPLKRLLDIVVALVVLILLGPLMLLTAVAIAWTSPGPVIFRQTRLGKDGAPFTFYKFRSMRTDSDDSIHRNFVSALIQGQAEGSVVDETGVSYKLKADPRVTPIGKWLRKSSIDELPQLYNVLKGDMSLVGPRPAIPYEAQQYQSWHLRRILSVKPGITGLWQVEGRSRVTFNDMVRMDLRYIRDCSLALDLKIMLKTFAVVLRCEGAT